MKNKNIFSKNIDVSTVIRKDSLNDELTDKAIEMLHDLVDEYNDCDDECKEAINKITVYDIINCLE